MQQEDIEKMAFFYLCGERDQKILKKTEKMAYLDFQRFDYLTRRLGFWEYNKRIWKEFSAEFKEKIEKERIVDVEQWEIEEEMELEDEWWRELTKKHKELLDLEMDYC